MSFLGAQCSASPSGEAGLETIAVVGLGYVGLPLAVAFAGLRLGRGGGSYDRALAR